MKKAVVMVSVTVFSILAILCAGDFYTKSIEEVDAFTVRLEQGVEYVTCTGNLERKEETNIYVKSIALVDEIYVKNGDSIKAGDKLLKTFSATGSASEISYITETPKYTYAPVSGTVVSVHAETGEFAYPGEKVIVIADTQEMQVRLFVNEANISKVNSGQEAIITGSGFLSSYAGTVSEISEEAIQTASSAGKDTSVEVLVTIDTPEKELKPGLSASVKILSLQKNGIVIVPYETVKADEEGNEFVYIIQNGCAVQRPVTTGEEFNNGFEIVEGLSENDVVIKEPDLVSDGKRVIIRVEE